MIRLISKQPEGTQDFELDINQNSRVILNFQNIEPPDVQIRKSSYSGAFSLPFSERNNQFFGHYYKVSVVDGSFDPSKKAECQLYSDGILVFEGALRLLSVSITNQSYQVSINAIEKDLFLTIGNGKLADLFEVVSDYDYFPTAENFKEANLGNDITIGGVGAGIVGIPFCDYGTSDGGRLIADTGIGLGIINAGYVKAIQMKPSIKIKHLLEKILEPTGYTIENSGLYASDTMDRLHMLLNTESETLPIRPFAGFKVGWSSAPFIISNAWQTVTYDLQSGSYLYDPENLIGPTNGVFTSNTDFTGILTFKAEVDYSNAYAIGQTIEMRVLKNGVVAHSMTKYIYPPGTWATDFTDLVISNIFQIEAGDVMVVQIRRNGGAGPFPIIQATDAVASAGYWTLYSYDVNLSTEPVSFKGTMPDMLQSDLLRDILVRFNAQLNPTQDANVLRMESAEANSGVVLDWTRYLDVDSQITITPPSQFRKRYFNLKDKQNNTWGSQYAQQALGIELGTYRFDSGDEWADGEETYEGQFGAYQMGQIPDASGGSQYSSTPIPFLFQQDGESVKGTTFPPILLFKDDASANFGTGGGFYMDNTYIQYIERFGLYENFYPGTGELSVQWDHRWQGDFGTPYAGVGGWVRSYWLGTLNELYNQNAKMITCGLFLSPREIEALDWTTRVQIAGDQYKVISISGYDASSPKVCQAKLLRVGQPVGVNTLFPNGEDVCNATVAATNPDGTVVWAWTETGTLAEDICCIEWGYFWDGSDCYWNVQNMPATGGRGTTLMPTREGLDFSKISLDQVYKSYEKPLTAGFPVITNGLQWDMNREAISLQSRFMRFSMSATTTNTTQEIARRNDLDEGGFLLLPEMACRMEINAIGVYVTGKRALGSTAYLQMIATVKNVGGTISIVAEHEDQNQRDSGLGSPSISILAGTKAISSADSVQIAITGESDTHILWSLDVFASFISFQGFGTDDTLIIQESTEPLETENGTFLSTEE